MRAYTLLARQLVVGLGGAAALALGAMPACVASSADLGGYPVCEASAALVVPCPTRPGSPCLLVGDNEQSQALFQYPIDGARVEVGARALVDIGGLLVDEGSSTHSARGELSDVEALAQLASGEVLVYGSHGRNKECDRKKKRRRYLGLRLGRAGAERGEIGLVRMPKTADLAAAFGPSPTGLLAEAAERVRTVEHDADAGRCDAAFDIEGAVAVSDRSKAGRESVWIGLRSPRVRGRAILARQDLSAGSLRFDAVRLLDLDGEGIRALSMADGFVWGLSKRPGGLAPSSTLLWRFPLEALSDEAGDQPIRPETVTHVPERSEGLAIADQWIFILADGRVGAGICDVDSTHVVLSRPLEIEDREK